MRYDLKRVAEFAKSCDGGDRRANDQLKSFLRGFTKVEALKASFASQKDLDGIMKESQNRLLGFAAPHTWLKTMDLQYFPKDPLSRLSFALQNRDAIGVFKLRDLALIEGRPIATIEVYEAKTSCAPDITEAIQNRKIAKVFKLFLDTHKPGQLPFGFLPAKC